MSRRPGACAFSWNPGAQLMRHARAYGFAGLAALAVAAAAFAQTTVTPLPDAEPVETAPLTEASATDALAEADWGDPQAGAQKAAVCAACHGVDGNPTDPMYPRVAGQSERYIARQLALFKRSEEHTSELQSRENLVCRRLLEKKNRTLH